MANGIYSYPSLHFLANGTFSKCLYLLDNFYSGYNHCHFNFEVDVIATIIYKLFKSNMLDLGEALLPPHAKR